MLICWSNSQDLFMKAYHTQIATLYQPVYHLMNGGFLQMINTDRVSRRGSQWYVNTLQQNPDQCKERIDRINVTFVPSSSFVLDESLIQHCLMSWGQHVKILSRHADSLVQSPFTGSPMLIGRFSSCVCHGTIWHMYAVCLYLYQLCWNDDDDSLVSVQYPSTGQQISIGWFSSFVLWDLNWLVRFIWHLFCMQCTTLRWSCHDWLVMFLWLVMTWWCDVMMLWCHWLVCFWPWFEIILW